ncbi:hypothetical protein SeMB42_g01978 [Synchytrium endobioticum]|nr:hypothetical protein SeMB42_g01978 [Synchytrium endobioticum]
MQGLLSKSALTSALKWALNHALCIPLPELAFERAITVMQDVDRHKVQLQRDDWAIFLSSLQEWQKLDTVFTQLIPSWGTTLSMLGLQVILEICRKMCNEFAAVTCLDMMTYRMVSDVDDVNSAAIIEMLKACQVFKLTARKSSDLLAEYLEALSQHDHTTTPLIQDASPRKVL